MSVAEGLALAYLKVGLVGAVVIVAVMLLVRAIENRAKARKRVDAALGTSKDDPVSR